MSSRRPAQHARAPSLNLPEGRLAEALSLSSPAYTVGARAPNQTERS